MTSDQHWKNILYYGDNLEIMRNHVKDESITLIYLDPPFNSQASYNILFAEKNGTASAAQIEAFEDTWHYDMSAESSYWEAVKYGPKALAELLQALRGSLGASDMMAYIVMMAVRLVEMRRVLASDGSIFLHCDPTASHYLKLVMDSIFGPKYFRNEIIWKRTLPHGNVRQMFGRSHDVIFFYCKGDKPVWNQQFDPHRKEYIEQFYRYTDPDTGRRYRLVSCINPNPNRPNLTYEWNEVTKVWKWTKERMKKADEEGLLVYSKNGIPSYKNYLDEMKGTAMQDVWEDIPPLMGSSRERLGYQTQKPEALLERIIKASSNEGDVVMDPFCGCGSAIAVAEKLHRRWIGIDITHLAITLMKRRLEDTFGSQLTPYEVIGDPKDLEGAKVLAEQDRFQFQWWSLDLVDARPAGGEPKKGADKGIDGYIFFSDDESGKFKQVIVSVKSGKVHSHDIRDLKGVLDREKAEIGVLLTLQEPTKAMQEEAREAGTYVPDHYPDYHFPRIQILTIQEVLEEKRRIEYPRFGLDTTFKKAKRQKKKTDEQGSLLDIRLAQKVNCKSCDAEFELDEPVRLLQALGAVKQGSTSKTKQVCPACGEEHDYSSDDVTNVFEGPAEE